MSEKKSVLITTAIDYVNAQPHVGHAVEKVQADVLARFYRGRGDEVFFLTGADENSLKNVLAARKEGKETAQFVAENTQKFEDLKPLLNLSYDKFIKTTSDEHFEGCKKLWQAMKPEDIYQNNYEGFYCVGCEEFKTEKDLVDGKCPEHQTAPEKVSEQNYFFKLSNYQEKLLEVIESNKLKIVPDFRRNEVISFIKGGLEDFSISRSRERACNWGVPVPGDESQIMYVWVDALANYITALGYGVGNQKESSVSSRTGFGISKNEEMLKQVQHDKNGGDLFQKFWVEGDKKIHMIGKGIMRFHAVYWIAMLLSAGLPLPSEIYIHEYLTIDGQKMSKSLGNVIYPAEITSRYGLDAARYLLLSALPYNGDGDISWEKLDAKYTADLCNGIGNLVQRVLSMINKYGVKVEAHPPQTQDDIIGKLTGEYKFELALAEVINMVRDQNVYIDNEKPWQVAKTDQDKLGAILSSVFGVLNHIASSLEPYMPETSKKISLQLDKLEPSPLFPRLEAK